MYGSSMSLSPFESFLNDVHNTKTPATRMGQHAYNVLFSTHPEVANTILGTTLDPFYDDKRLPTFYTAVMTALEEEE